MIARESTVFVGRKRRDEGREEKYVFLSRIYMYLDISFWVTFSPF